MRQQPAQAAMTQARALVALHRYDNAVVALRHALASEPEMVEAHCLLAQCLLELRDQPRLALAEAERAAALAPNLDWAHRLRALAYMRIGSSRKAIEAAREASRIAPNNPNCHIVLSDALRQRRKLNEAREVAERARELAPNSAATHISVGLVALSERNNQEAEAHFRAALALEPENATALNNLGVAALRQGRRNAAIAYFADASRINPRHSLARRNAVSAAGTGAGIFVAIALLANLVSRSSGGTIAAVVIGVGIMALVSNARRGRRREGCPDEPVASKELIRELRKEARRSGTSVRWGWLLGLTAICVLMIVAVCGLLVLLDAVANSTIDIGDVGVALLVTTLSAGGAYLLIRRRLR